jgi:hypothetical protein
MGEAACRRAAASKAALAFRRLAFPKRGKPSCAKCRLSRCENRAPTRVDPKDRRSLRPFRWQIDLNSGGWFSLPAGRSRDGKIRFQTASLIVVLTSRGRKQDRARIASGQGTTKRGDETAKSVSPHRQRREKACRLLLHCKPSDGYRRVRSKRSAPMPRVWGNSCDAARRERCIQMHANTKSWPKHRSGRATSSGSRANLRAVVRPLRTH